MQRQIPILILVCEVAAQMFCVRHYPTRSGASNSKPYIVEVWSYSDGSPEWCELESYVNMGDAITRYESEVTRIEALQKTTRKLPIWATGGSTWSADYIRSDNYQTALKTTTTDLGNALATMLKS